MSILVDRETKLCTSGITGREGTFHTLNNRNYGTNVVAGVTPGKGGQDVEGIPVFNTFHDAVAQTGANTAMIFVPPRFAADSILEAEDAGIDLVICITEGIPAHDELRVYNHLQTTRRTSSAGTGGRARLIGPNCPGVLSPGKANVGIIPAAFFKEGNVGVVSRSGTLTYQIGNELAQRGFGNSSIVGIGGDPVPGSSFIDIIELFEQDPQTELIVMSGEIGGDAEERAAEYIKANVSKPVVAYIAGVTAPPGKRMGHAGAVIAGGKGTAADKYAALEEAGVRTVRSAADLGVAMKQALATRRRRKRKR
jgi:succinyl-CoA synthetase alpha subunit